MFTFPSVYVSASQGSDNSLASHRHQNKETLLELSKMSPELSTLIKKKLDMIESVAKKGIGSTLIGFGRFSQKTYGN